MRVQSQAQRLRSAFEAHCKEAASEAEDDARSVALQHVIRENAEQALRVAYLNWRRRMEG